MKKKLSVKEQKGVVQGAMSIPDSIPDHWRKTLEAFFDENETGMDYMRYLMDVSRTYIDHYNFIIEPEMDHFSDHKPHNLPKPIKSKRNASSTCIGLFTMNYEGSGCFRYALPE